MSHQSQTNVGFTLGNKKKGAQAHAVPPRAAATRYLFQCPSVYIFMDLFICLFMKTCLFHYDAITNLAIHKLFALAYLLMHSFILGVVG